MSLGYLSPIANHLWQSTLFAGMVLLLTLALWKHRAEARYLLWLAASLKFLVPFSLLMAIGSQLETRSLPPVTPGVAIAAAQVSQAFAPIAVPDAPAPAAARDYPAVAAIALALWFTGFAAVVCVWALRWRRVSVALRAATPLNLEAPIPVMSSPTLLEPGVFGIVRPVLLLPQGIAERLAPAQLRAILAHELCHVRRRDNLAAAVHMFVEAVFWFHPLVWWIGGRLVDERERACDEEVLRLGSEPEVYAESILNVCKFYIASPMACASGVTGSDLKKRIEAIMSNPALARMSFAGKLLLAGVALAAVASPIFVGMVTRAQTKPDTLTFEVASIRPADPDSNSVTIQVMPGGGLKTENVRLQQLIEFAYQVHPFQVSGGPQWVNSEAFDILAKGGETPAAADGRQMNDAERQLMRERIRERLRMLLAERFQLKIRREIREMPVYALVVANNGPKVKEAVAGAGGGRQQMRIARGHLTAERMPMQALAVNLSREVGRPVLDRTSLKGNYDFKLEWTPDGPMGSGNPIHAAMPAGGAAPPELTGPSLFTALQEQLGLKLESTRGPVEAIVIEHAAKPSAN